MFTRLSSIHTKDLAKPKNVTPNDDVKPVEEFLEESSTEDQFSLEAATTTEPTTTVETYHKLTLSVNAKKNISREFRPSVHLGEIKESRISASPFNALRHFNLDNGVNPGSYHEHLKDFQIVYQPAVKTVQTLQTPRPANQENIHQNLYETAVGSIEETKNDGTQQNGYVKFQDDALDASKVPYSSSKDQTFHQHVSNSVFDNSGTQHDLVDQQIYQNLEKPAFEQETSIIWGKPSKFHGEPQRGPELNVNPLKTPHFPIVYDHQDQHSNLQDFDLSKKPNDGVVFVQESSFTRTRKYPYPYQSHGGYNHAEFVDDKRSSPLKRRVSPWKKIFHLIGAIIPLGLLIAALTPNVVKVDNTTQPNIVLSKWRVADLPVEHKQARFNDPLNDCEERSICGMILAGGDAGSSVLQNILWNLATRTSTTMAKESGLHEVFEAVKKKDCTSVFC
ncbi:uncharacterized protein LOC122538787 [Frieseomelitta varia]|uniref:uncharacterized protein LOC122538787 n=1 Tax=Frieseomelitta varia TaxID=561572 RepID=UPI001CB6AEFE|nr:uncharacterized protein LOC122538787 [Frieseomelitta varia]